MEPVTHVLTGACLARSGLNRKAAYATLAMAVGAEFPDIDTVWSWRGPVDGFAHRRGITHTFLGIPFEAALLLGCVWLLHRWRIRRARTHQRPGNRPLTAAPVRWGWLYFLLILALLSHLLLDYTNNYGLRPFFPFNPHWYAASIVFIFDPLLFAVLLIGVAAPWIFGLVGREVGAKKKPFQGRGFAGAALIFVVLYYGARVVEHGRAVDLAMEQSLLAPQSEDSVPLSASNQPAPLPVYLQPQRVLASPDPLSIFRWYTVTDFGPVYQLGQVQLAQVDTRDGTYTARQATEPKPARTPAILAAERTLLGRVYMDWSPMPFVDALPAADGGTMVTFRDPRFMGDTPLLHNGKEPPLTGTVLLEPENQVLQETLDGKVQPLR